MKTLKYLVTGATGKVGNRVARELISQGHSVRAFGRSRERLQPLVDLGAEAFIGNMQDFESVDKAFQGIDAALLVCQGDHGKSRDFRLDFSQTGTNYAKAAQKNKVKSLVYISTSGSGDYRTRGLFRIHSDVEEILNQIPDVNVVHLRAPIFFELLFYFLQFMVEHNILAWPIPSEVPLNIGSSQDVADVAVEFLTKLDFQGKKVVELHGENGINLSKIAGLISKALDRPFRAIPISRNADVERMVAAGIGRDFANVMSDAWESVSQGHVELEKNVTTIQLPAKMEDYIRDQFAPAIQQSLVGSKD